MPTNNKKTGELIEQMKLQCAELTKCLQNLLVAKSQVVPETVRDQKDLDLDKHLIASFVEQIDHYTTVISEDNSKECYCELELAECTNNCKF